MCESTPDGERTCIFVTGGQGARLFEPADLAAEAPSGPERCLAGAAVARSTDPSQEGLWQAPAGAMPAVWAIATSESVTVCSGTPLGTDVLSWLDVSALDHHADRCSRRAPLPVSIGAP